MQDVAYGVASAFISRNNDLDGYWALGHLYDQALALDSRGFRFDLLAGEAMPANQTAQRVARTYQQKLSELLARKSIAASLLRSAELSIEFNAPEAAPAQQTYGDVFAAVLTIEDDHGRRYSVSKRGFCAPHNPSRELRSGRAGLP